MISFFLEAVHNELGISKTGFFSVSDLFEERNINGVLSLYPLIVYFVLVFSSSLSITVDSRPKPISIAKELGLYCSSMPYA
jgi:hypothetical protein